MHEIHLAADLLEAVLNDGECDGVNRHRSSRKVGCELDLDDEIAEPIDLGSRARIEQNLASGCCTIAGPKTIAPCRSASRA